MDSSRTKRKVSPITTEIMTPMYGLLSIQARKAGVLFRSEYWFSVLTESIGYTVVLLEPVSSIK